ncbi:Plancitoxin-1 [Eumeta japonica]|uniref:Plancitoxin-1 n=1 Tax=Eumeta variegata TaxID=151549 RepID=A0A4C1T6Y5_EUMVA|nr:Plancitoxin-1 [Eumeta japonica]
MSDFQGLMMEPEGSDDGASKLPAPFHVYSTRISTSPNMARLRIITLIFFISIFYGILWDKRACKPFESRRSPVAMDTRNPEESQCKDENNNPVDWFYIYKFPKQKYNSNPLLGDGVAYMYMTAMKANHGWILSNLSIEDPTSMLGRTLAPMYKNENIISLLYNDQPPPNEHLTEILEFIPLEKQSIIGENDTERKKQDMNKNEYYYEYDMEEKGHTKGVILGDITSSFWLVHSVPKFPSIPTASQTRDWTNASAYELDGSDARLGPAAAVCTRKCFCFKEEGSDESLKYTEAEVPGKGIIRVARSA